MKLRLKTYAAFSSFMLLVLIMFVTVFNLIGDLNEDLGAQTELKYKKKSLSGELRAQVTEMGRVLRDPQLLVGGDFLLEEAFTSNRNAAVMSFESLKLYDQEIGARPMLVNLEVQFNEYLENAEYLLATLKVEDTPRITNSYKLEQASRERLLERNEEYATYLDREMAQLREQTQEKLQMMRVVVLLIFMGVLLMTTVIVVVTVRKIFDNLSNVVSVMNNMALGSADAIERMKVNADDELGAIANAYNRLADTLDRHIRYERAYQKEIEEQNWIKTTIADITTMYQGVQDVETLARRLLSKLAPLIGASFGAFYMADFTGGNDSKLLRKLADYAGDDALPAKETFRFGEGLIGQCAEERQTIYLQNLTESMYKIRSAMLDTTPTEVIIVPVEHEEDVLAVVEFATLTSFSPLHQLLLQQVMNNVGITIMSVLGQMRVQLLLHDSQAMTMELKSKSEEMQQQQVELISINGKLEEQYRSSELRSLELQSIKAELEGKARLLEQNSRYKSEFLANMSHELRTPLNSLLILTRILLDNEEGRLSEKQLEYTKAIYSSGEQLLQLINDILDLSKAESGKVQVNKELVRMSELLLFAEKMFMPVAREKKLAFTIEQAPDVPDILYSDPQRIMQIMNNLLANAFKFTEQGGVTLKVDGFGEQLATGSYDWIKISVTDTGIGIPEEKQGIIFEAFQQADGTTSRKYGGTGLGLSISRNIAELLGGSIGLESSEGIGSTFSLYLPLDEEAVRSAPMVFARVEAASGKVEAVGEQPEEVKPLQGHTVLVVDDDIRNVFALTAVLEAQKLTVLFAENGYDGLVKLDEHPEIDLVLMDIMMPEMDGITAIQAIRSKPHYQQLPVIALTAKAMKTDQERCMEAGASDYLSKPVQQEQLVSLIRSWIFRDYTRISG